MMNDFAKCDICNEPAANQCSCGTIICYDCCRLGEASDDPICPSCKKEETTPVEKDTRIMALGAAWIYGAGWINWE